MMGLEPGKEGAAGKYNKEREQSTYKAEETSIDKVDAEDLIEALQETKETAAVLDQWAPADLKMWFGEAFKYFPKLINPIEKQGRWPTQMQNARAAFSAKEEEGLIEPESNRVLFMLPAVYRLWATTGSQHLAPWI